MCLFQYSNIKMDKNSDIETPELKRQSAITIFNTPDFEDVFETEVEKEVYALIDRLIEEQEKKDLQRATTPKNNKK